MFFNKGERRPVFNEGDVVRVKSREQISDTIRSTGKLDGCLFTEQMWNYCGNVYPVLRVIDSFFDERKKRSFKPKAPVYILENLICDGRNGRDQPECDHGCFLLWHEDWLESV